MNYTSRQDVPLEYTWDLSEIFPTKQDWENELDNLTKTSAELASFQGKLGNKIDVKIALDANFNFEQKLVLLYSYASKLFDLNTKDTDGQSSLAKVRTLDNTFESITSYISPELTALSEKQLNDYIADKDLSDYSEFFKDILATKAHVLSDKEEALLALSGNAMDGYSNIFSMINNADIQFPVVKDPTGKEFTVTHGGYGMILGGSDRDLREKAFHAYYQAFRNNLNTITATYAGSVKSDWFYAKARKYNSCLDKAMSDENVPECVYFNLMESIDNSTYLMHDYMRFRKQVMGVSQLHMYDMHTAIIQGRDMHLDIKDAYKVVKEGLKPLGEDYQNLLDTAFNNRWIDVYETAGKRSGAYSSGVFNLHPYVLLNYQPDMNNVFTIAHELGHAMHSYKSNNTQPYSKCHYKIFLAEIASTTNEVLLLKHLISTTEDKDMKKTLLAHYIDMFRTTIFRQSMFAEFEHAAHVMEEKGEPLTSVSLSDKYYELNKKYYGPDVFHDEDIAIEWCRIPHFYTPFYVYKYATGLISGIAIAKKILAEGQPMVDKYMKFLSAGGSDAPCEILKLAGIDLTTKQPFEYAMQELKDSLDELKKMM